MKLLELLSTLDDQALDQLAEEYVGKEPAESRSHICLNLEREFRSPNHVRATVMNLQPPGFAIVNELLDSEGYSIPIAGLKERALESSLALSERITNGDLFGDLDKEAAQKRVVYRKVLYEARRSDLELDPSEVKLLAILRQALGIRTAEHFLMEHHADFHGFWRTEHAFLDVLRTMRGRGLGFVENGMLVLPSDVVDLIQQVLGLEGSASSRRRVLEHVNNDDLRGALEAHQLRLSGSKEERLRRIVDHFLQPREVLQSVSLATLRDIAKDAKVTSSGAKDELVERIAVHFANGWDLRTPEPPPPPPPPEPRTLDDEAFVALFDSLRGEDLTDILTGIGSSRVSGAKDHKVKLLKESRFSEVSLLLQLDAKQLDGVLAKRRMKPGGSKRERAERIVTDAANPPPSLRPAQPT